MYVVAQSVMFPSLPDLPSKEPDIIQATLMFELPTLMPEIPVTEIEEETPLPVEPEERLVKETPKARRIEPISETEVQAIPISPKPLKLETEMQKAKEKEKEKEKMVPEEPKKNNELNNFIITEQTVTPIPSPEMLSPTTSMARRHLNSFQQQQQNKVADQASRYYQLHKNSPVINVEVENPFMTEDDKIINNLKVRADCSNTGKKAATAILSLLGGVITCSKPPAIKGFIQDRINKKHLSGGQYRQRNKTRPGSVVIKKQP